ncbi:hypothetical protein EMIHUDRAFT_249290 [Emiliania huxleyi CCMP1516]|uniref:Uncharacterized protein n=2 Tax=Emiliania huxleyi TaxID=2903 RepID=A0A0D3I9F2_EMIH1|nr:hypothetical protein EMIHUDRAFT_249290 [Emiliania huxleyi CCMP1516]EOD07887.1 hypothetical protein EMIHUDRAFT_249290 [Emiliania huxleyi CCMP1516]|eukprot:XP_005760316.1 hypothetical protein EMIHUDRAFT_249290 [Emiliania huxleyi CCMP1516]
MCSVVLQLWSQASALSLRLLPTALRRRQHVSSLSPTATATAAGAGSASRDPGWVAALQMLRDSRERYVIVDAKNGLGNRLRALASAMAVAATLDRPLLLVWVSDLHCNCSFRRLFAQPLPFTLLEEEIPLANLTDPRHFQRYNYMRPEPGAVKDAPIIPDPRRHLYFKSAFVMNHAHGKWTHAQQQIQRLVGLHIRNVFDAPRDSRTFSSTTGNEAIAAAEKEYGRKGTSKLLARFPNRILVTRRECASERCDFRDCEGTLYALVDMLNLARTRLILGSGWLPPTSAARALVGAEHGRYSPKTPCCNPLEGGTDGARHTPTSFPIPTLSLPARRFWGWKPGRRTATRTI